MTGYTKGVVRSLCFLRKDAVLDGTLSRKSCGDGKGFLCPD